MKTARDVAEIEVTAGPRSPGDLGITSDLGLVASAPFSHARAFTSLAGVACRRAHNRARLTAHRGASIRWLVTITSVP